MVFSSLGAQRTLKSKYYETSLSICSRRYRIRAIGWLSSSSVGGALLGAPIEQPLLVRRLPVHVLRVREPYGDLFSRRLRRVGCVHQVSAKSFRDPKCTVSCTVRRYGTVSSEIGTVPTGWSIRRSRRG